MTLPATWQEAAAAVSIVGALIVGFRWALVKAVAAVQKPMVSAINDLCCELRQSNQATDKRLCYLEDKVGTLMTRCIKQHQAPEDFNLGEHS